ncbi:hypothetical protein CBS115989_1107 [Aspergillus niger]|nr:hypothetical protein CBS115989_1107 [Aspergillus niger]
MCSYAHLTRSLSRSHTFSTSIIAPLTRPPTTYAINYSQPHSYSTASHHQTQSLTMHLPSSQRICHDWMVVQGNVHYARDRAHFTTYRPVTAHLKNNIFNPMDELEVAGIGTVEIPVVRSLDNPFDTHTIVLENVLHIPEAILEWPIGRFVAALRMGHALRTPRLGLTLISLPRILMPAARRAVFRGICEH